MEWLTIAVVILAVIIWYVTKNKAEELKNVSVDESLETKNEEVVDGETEEEEK